MIQRKCVYTGSRYCTGDMSLSWVAHLLVTCCVSTAGPFSFDYCTIYSYAKLAMLHVLLLYALRIPASPKSYSYIMGLAFVWGVLRVAYARQDLFFAA